MLFKEMDMGFWLEQAQTVLANRCPSS